MGGLAAFAAGLGSGYLRGAQQQLENERQAKRDEQADQLFTERMAGLRDEREQRENQKAIDKAIADAGKAGQVEENVAGVTYTNPNGEQKTAYQPDQQTADFAAQQQRLEEGSAPTAPAAASNPTATSATSVRDFAGNRKLFTGLNAATDAKAFADENQAGSYAHYMNLRNKLSGMMGGQAKADEYLKRAKEAQKEGVFETLMALESKNPDPAAAKKLFNSTGTFKMADNQNFVADVGADGKPTGKWNVVETQPDGSQKVVLNDVKNFAINRLAGAEGVVSRANAKDKLANEIALKTWEYENDPTKRFKDTKPGGQIFDTKTGQYVASNETGYVPATDAAGNIIYDEDGEPRMVRAGTGGRGPAGSAKAGGPSATIKDSLKGNEAGIGTATELAAAFRRNDPTMPAETADALGLRAASGANRRAVFNPNTGMFDEYYDDKPTLDKDGKPAGFATGKSYLVQSHQYAKGGAINDKDAQSAVAQIQQAVPKEKFDSYAQAKTDAGYKTFRDNLNTSYAEVANKVKADVEAVRNDANLTPQQKQAKVDQIISAGTAAQQMMQADMRRMELVRQFYQPPAPKDNNAKPTQGSGFGMNYTPPADSPAGRAAARQAELRAANEKKAQDRLANQQALSKQFQADLKTMAPVDVARKYQDADLPTADLATLRSLKY